MKKIILLLAVLLTSCILVFNGFSSTTAKADSTSEGTDNVMSTGVEGPIYIGDRVYFGNYPQSTNVPEPILWRVLEVKGDTALLISEYALDCVPYNDVHTNVKWENCSLRKWLRNDFMPTAFTEEEQEAIILTTNENPKNDVHGTSGGGNTQDYVFCLSQAEAYRYFKDASDRLAAPTPFAISRGSRTKGGSMLPSGETAGWWWLRTPGEDNGNAVVIYNNGINYAAGTDVNNKDKSVRPAMWVKIYTPETGSSVEVSTAGAEGQTEHNGLTNCT